MIDERETKRAFNRFLDSIDRSMDSRELEVVFRTGEKFVLKVEVARIEKPRRFMLLDSSSLSSGSCESRAQARPR
jgi:hypothetical protein